jgi:hypothetical protein
MTSDFFTKTVAPNGWYRNGPESIMRAFREINAGIRAKKTSVHFESHQAKLVKMVFDELAPGIFDVTYSDRVCADVTVRINIDYDNMPVADFTDLCRSLETPTPVAALGEAVVSVIGSFQITRWSERYLFPCLAISLMLALLTLFVTTVLPLLTFMAKG